MSKSLGLVTLAFLLAIGGSAAAQAPPITAMQTEGLGAVQPPTDASQIQFTAEQKATIQNAVRPERAKAKAATRFNVAVGASVPASLELYLLPDVVLTQVPAAKAVKYTILDDQIVLIDPTTMRVIDFIRL